MDVTLLNAKRDAKIEMHGSACECVYHLIEKLRNEN